MAHAEHVDMPNLIQDLGLASRVSQIKRRQGHEFQFIGAFGCYRKSVYFDTYDTLAKVSVVYLYIYICI